MIFVPFATARRPKTYRKVIRKQAHVTGADCIVQARVHFPVTEVVNPETLSINTLMDATYAFRLTVHLSKDEYESNWPNLDEYVCNKIKRLDEYSKLLKSILEQQPYYRDYEIDIFVPKDDLNYLKIHEYTEEFEEYVPV